MQLIRKIRSRNRKTPDTTIEPVYTTQSPGITDITYILDEIDDSLEKNEVTDE